MYMRTFSGKKEGFSMLYSAIRDIGFDGPNNRIEITFNDGTRRTFKDVLAEDHQAIWDAYRRGRDLWGIFPVTYDAVTVEKVAKATEAAEAEAKSAQAASTGGWSNTTVIGNTTRKASEAVLRQCHGAEKPWLILNAAGFSGTLIAFDDRLVIIKTGAMTSLLAGSLGGERSAVFYFSEITGIEYNSGFLNGVLEVLTASYSGTANKDFWRGAGSSRNRDDNDPFKLSNTLPLGKSEYQAALPQIQELRARVGRAKQPTVQVVSAPAAPATDLVSQLERLSELLDKGALSAEEYAAAKARLISGD
jgi:hypothetical protein